MRTLVTGGAGFIGSHIVDALVEAGHEVALVDDFSTGKPAYVSSGAVVHQADIRAPELAAAFANASPEVVFHVAAHASVSESVRDPQRDAEVNVLGTLNVLRECAAHGVGRIVFSSTGGALYGEPERLPADERHPARPLSPYGASKASGEAYVAAMSQLAGMRYAVLRYANVYGPRQDPNGEAGVVAIFIGSMLAGKQPTIYGDGFHERDYVYVDDVVRANLLAMESARDGAFNIGTGRGTTVREVFDACASATRYAGEPRYAPERQGDVRRVYLDAALAGRELGWRAEVGFAEGIARVVAAMGQG